MIMVKPRDGYFYQIINKNRFSKDTDVREGCLQILDFLTTYESALDVEHSFYFEDLRQHVHPDINNSDFIYAVFYLTRPNIQVLSQEFSVWDERISDYVHYHNKQIISEILRDKEYVNPLSGEPLSQEDFEEQVLTFFTPTAYFLEKRYE